MSFSKKWVKLIDSDETIVVTDIEGLEFIDYEVPTVKSKSNSVDMAGIDGKLPSIISFDTFSLKLIFRYTGIDVFDAESFCHSIRPVFNRRRPYYITHNRLPGIKYAIDQADVSFEKETLRHYKIIVEFNVYKGYSESIHTTQNIIDFSSYWSGENHISLTFNPKYKHKSNQFTIWNGSNDIIKPQFGHQLNIKLNVQSNGGFELVNLTTGDIFKYKKSSNKDTDIVLNSIYAYRENYRCGIDTNRGVITLAPGYNEFKIKGEVSSCSSEFDFPFIYR
ncbi:phage tail domain-containing protein [Staphylococcus xylosus]